MSILSVGQVLFFDLFRRRSHRQSRVTSPTRLQNGAKNSLLEGISSGWLNPSRTEQPFKHSNISYMFVLKILSWCSEPLRVWSVQRVENAQHSRITLFSEYSKWFSAPCTLYFVSARCHFFAFRLSCSAKRHILYSILLLLGTSREQGWLTPWEMVPVIDATTTTAGLLLVCSWKCQ